MNTKTFILATISLVLLSGCSATERYYGDDEAAGSDANGGSAGIDSAGNAGSNGGVGTDSGSTENESGGNNSSTNSSTTGSSSGGNTSTTSTSNDSCIPKTCLEIATELVGNTRDSYMYSIEPDACGTYDDGCGNSIDCGGCDSDIADCGLMDFYNITFELYTHSRSVAGLCQGGCQVSDDMFMEGYRCWRCSLGGDPFEFNPNLVESDYTAYENDVGWAWPGTNLWCTPLS
jgi:hypothetical protein